MAGFGKIFSDWLTLPWEQARTFVREELESLRLSISAHWAQVFSTSDTLLPAAIQGDPTKGRRYVANTGTNPKFSPKWEKAVYEVDTDDVYVQGGPIQDSGTISASEYTETAVDSATHTLFGGI